MGIRLEELPLKYQEQVRKKSLAKEDNKLVQTLQNNGKSKSKYGNQKCELDGIKFDSKKEMRRYTQLKAMVSSGYISNLHIHERFNLQHSYTDVSGNKVDRIDYEADFTYLDSDGKLHIEDVKSKVTVQNSTYKLKKKLMAGQGYFIEEI